MRERGPALGIVAGGIVALGVVASGVAAGGVVSSGGVVASSGVAAVQPDLGPRRPVDPPPTRHAIELIGDRVSADLESLERARRAAIGDTRAAVDAAIALRHALAELAGVASADARPEDGDLVLAAAVTADLGAWDAVLRGAVDEPATAAAVRAFAAALDGGDAMDATRGARARLASAARGLIDHIEPAGAGVGAGADGDAREARGGNDRDAQAPLVDEDATDPARAGALLDRAIRAADWLGGTDELLVPHRAGAVDPGGAAVVRRAAEVIDAITAIRPQARRRARLRGAVDQLAEAWPASADARTLTEVDRGWRRLGGIVEVAARRRALAGRLAPRELGIELRRLTGLLAERAEAAELAAIDRVEDLLLGPGPTRDPALVSIVIGFRQAVENLDRLHEREDWLDAVAAIDPSLRTAAEAWIDERLLRLGAPAQRARAARRLAEFDDLLASLGRPPGYQRMEDPAPADRALVGNRTREIIDAFARARRERLALAFGGEAAPSAGSLDRWLDLMAMIDVVGRARDRLAARGAEAASANPDWFVVVPADDLVAEASRAIDVAVDRALDAGDGGGPPTDAVALARMRVAVAAAWLAAAEGADDAAHAGRLDAGGSTAPGVPGTMIAATRPSTQPALAEISVHAVEAAAARRAGDEAAADAHRDTAVWIASTDFDPTMRTARRP